MRNGGAFLVAVVLFLFELIPSCSGGGTDTIRHGSSLRDNETIVSENGKFVLGFFTRNQGKSRYLGVWYDFSKDVIVWTANRRKPIPNRSGVLRLQSNGTLVLEQTNGSVVIWSSEGDTVVTDPVAKLLNSGNFVVRGNGRADDTWRSFDHPTDTILPGMKLGFDRNRGFEWYMTSWKSPDDPSVGNYTVKMDDKESSHEIYVKKGTNETIYRYGIWNGKYFSGIPIMKEYSDFKYHFVDNEDEAYYCFETVTNVFARLVLFPNGSLARMNWSPATSLGWTTFWMSTSTDCNIYSSCGPNGICIRPKVCRCHEGYKPKSTNAWNARHFEDGCVRKEKLSCNGSEVEPVQSPIFKAVEKGVKLPEASEKYTYNNTMSLENCRQECLSNCSCVAYAAIKMPGFNPRGCIMWFGDLVDTMVIDKVDGGQELCLRVRNGTIEIRPDGRNRKMLIAILATIGILLVLLCCALFLWKKKKNREMPRGGDVPGKNVDEYLKDNNLLVFDLATLASATRNFSNENVLGQGGYGVVYKGRMANDQDLAVKRLVKDASLQGLNEFVNEVTLIAKLQHRNLVRLVGCCMEGEERILIYEFMQNKSLDSIIFGERSDKLDWAKSVEIITGIARGLLYLHEDSRLKIIHRDLKAANVLLDDAMNPKISDFGTARIFRVDQMEDNTRRIIGTYGYMAPEYAMGGIFSTKSDVFSFGVLMSEIISGKKNKVFYQVENELNLLELAWQLWTQGKGRELVNSRLLQSSSCPLSDIIRFIQIGLLCIQNDAMDRPSMSTVLFMLNNDDGSCLPKPKKPGFNEQWMRERHIDSSSFVQQPPTVNKLTFTTMQGR